MQYFFCDVTHMTTKQPKTCLIRSCKEKATRRGLCEKHYSDFRREKESVPREWRKAYEAEQVAEGKLLPDGRVKKKEENPFSGTASNFMTRVALGDVAIEPPEPPQPEADDPPPSEKNLRRRKKKSEDDE